MPKTPPSDDGRVFERRGSQAAEPAEDDVEEDDDEDDEADDDEDEDFASEDDEDDFAAGLLVDDAPRESLR
ncbi:hypothetical protein EV284_5489 [Streptomyces sp. BK022]|nr:hypothetical protein EV284_5489 [Streptomyces sp. BK022]